MSGTVILYFEHTSPKSVVNATICQSPIQISEMPSSYLLYISALGLLQVRSAQVVMLDNIPAWRLQWHS